MTTDLLTAAAMCRVLGITRKEFRAKVAAGEIRGETTPGYAWPKYSLSRYYAAQQRAGELDAERRAS